jgi:ABC-type Fe3+ transport system permease subunit
MIVYRWLRAAARAVVGSLTVLPAIALVLAVLLDGGPVGAPRDPRFSLALFASDPFAWTCVRNSLLFATILTVLSLIGGVGLGWIMARRRYWGRGALRAAVTSMLAATPACLALGFLGLGRAPHPWPWPVSLRDASSGSLSLETWRGLPLWSLWIWSSLPGAVALITLATARALERFEPSWLDAARLAGAGRMHTWGRLTWPLIRPAAARAAGIVFPLALLEPGVPLILGLRRTLGFQIVETATRSEPFPRLAVWTAMAAGIAFAGRLLLRWWGGPVLLTPAAKGSESGRPQPPVPQAGAIVAVVCAALLAGAAFLGWLPILGLTRPFLDPAAGSASSAWSTAEIARRALAPPIPQLVVDSLILGLEVGACFLILAWLLRPDPGTRLAPTFASRLVGRFAVMPPLVQGVGILALPGLVGLTAASMRHVPGLAMPGARLADLALELAVGRNPRAILTVAVCLSVALRLLQSWRRAAERLPEDTRSGLEAALLAGSSHARARVVSSVRPRRWLGAFVLAALLAAVNLAPALLFTPWMDGRTIAPGMLILADGAHDGRLQASALALGVIAANLAGLCAARSASFSPPEWDPDPP